MIPLALIQAFFEKWLIGPSDNEIHESLNYNGCGRTLYGRLKRSLQKLVIVLVKKHSDITSDGCYRLSASIQSNVFSEIITYVDTMLRGNIFLGPADRGPFDPTFDLNQEGLLRAFEMDAAPIIGQDRFDELLLLFYDLQDFMGTIYIPRDLPPIWRLLDGFDLFINILNSMIGTNVTPLEPRQWELCVPTEQELRNVRTEELRRSLRNQSFWAISKSSSRSPRSTNHFQVEVIESSENLSLQDLRHQWTKFVVNVMTISTESNFRGESLIWLCNFTRLYNDFLFDQKVSIKITEDCPTCLSFDEYLYKKVSHSSDWIRCNKGFETSGDWCLAWKNIRTPGRTEYNDENQNDGMDDTIFTKDVETLMHWLSSKIQMKECKIREPALPTLRRHLWQPQKKTSILDETFCFLANTITFWTGECEKALSQR